MAESTDHVSGRRPESELREERVQVRRWIDKAFIGALMAVVSLGSVVYGLTTSSVYTRIQYVDEKHTEKHQQLKEKAGETEKTVERLDAVQRERGERMRVLEESRTAIQHRLAMIEEAQRRLEDKQGHMDKKIDVLIDRVK